MNPRYPVYIISKGRWDSRLTSKALESMRTPYSIVVEEQEYDRYAEVIDRRKILILKTSYQDDYDTCDDLGVAHGKGSGPARNFVWDHSSSRGAERHWIMDDNIKGFFRFQSNLKVPVSDGTILRCMEDFVDRYHRVSMAGPNYFMFVSRKEKRIPPFVLNTKLYSCNLILNSAPFRWRGRYNEDVDLTLRMLKSGWCTIQFNAFLQYKMPTQTIRGGNTDTVYSVGTLPKSQMIARLHPDVAKVVRRFGRWHHYVDYGPFKRNLLRKKAGDETLKGVDNYGMSLVQLESKRVTV